MEKKGRPEVVTFCGGSFPMGSRHVVEGRLLRAGDTVLADVRAFLATGDGRLVPTRNGLRIRSQDVQRLLRLLTELSASCDSDEVVF